MWLAGWELGDQRNLRPFTAKDKWEIQWDSKGSVLSITIYIADGKLVDLAVTQEGTWKWIFLSSQRLGVY
jgi:hypothetical protein